MKLTAAEVQQIAKLVRLRLSDEEVRLYRQQLSAVLDYVDQLSEVDTAKVVPTAQVTGQTTVLADDVVSNEPDPSGLLAGSPQREGDAIKVKAVFEAPDV